MELIYITMNRITEKVSPSQETEKGKEDLLKIVLSIKDKEELKSFIDDMFTEKEVEDVVQRYLLMDDLYKGKSQRDIARDRSMSLCKITRGSKMLKKKEGFMRKFFSNKYDDFTHI